MDSECKQILQLLDEMLETIAYTVLENSSFLELIFNLRELVTEWFFTTPIAEEKFMIKMKNIWKSNEYAKTKLKELQKSIEAPRKNMNIQLAAKNLLINKHDAKIKRLKEKQYTDMSQISFTTQQAITAALEDSNFHKKSINIDINIASGIYNATLTKHVIEEKQIRSERFELEKQLAVCLKKYDEDIGEKQALYEKMMIEYERQQQELEKLKEKFNIQEIHYKRMLEEKARIEQEELLEKVSQFITNRCARHIQEYWRAYKLRKAKHKPRRRRK